jgi:cytochrome c oxidase assembly protein subunit 11
MFRLQFRAFCLPLELQTLSQRAAARPLLRHYSANRAQYVQARNATYKQRNRNLLLYSAAVIVLGVGVTYAAVPLYRLFCSATGYGGIPMTAGGQSNNPRFEAARLVPRTDGGLAGTDAKKIRISFNADCSDSLPWKFSPLQNEVYVLPGETALAFYTATNKSDKDIIGIATYNVQPDKVSPLTYRLSSRTGSWKVAPYFAKVECFCFDEQKLLAGEEVDLPVFFFIDRDILDDPSMKDVDDVILSYTFL